MTDLKTDLLQLLEHSYSVESARSECPPQSRLEFLSDHIFDFTTYDSAMSELFAGKAVEVCAAINNGDTFGYISAPENYRWFLLMCNMPFFAGKLEWGTSIRGAWWAPSNEKFSLDSCGLWAEGRQICVDGVLTFTREDWPTFISAIVEFSAMDQQEKAQ